MKDYYFQEVTELRTGEGNRLGVVFADGFAAEIDLGPWIHRGGRQIALADPAFFARVQVNDGAPEWPGEMDVSPGSLRAWCEAGRVLSPEETNEWIARYGEPIEGAA